MDDYERLLRSYRTTHRICQFQTVTIGVMALALAFVAFMQLIK